MCFSRSLIVSDLGIDCKYAIFQIDSEMINDL